MNQYWPDPSYCPVCGGLFFITDVRGWAYKLGTKDTGLTYYCSWHCMRKEEKRLDGKAVPKQGPKD